MSSGVLVLNNVLPLIARHFYSLSTLAILRSTCKAIYEDTKEFTLLYRIVLQNTEWINKTKGKTIFILSHSDIRNIEYIDSTSLTYWQRFVNGHPRGHLVKRKALFERSISKYGSIHGICLAHIRREKRKSHQILKLFMRHLFQAIRGIIQNYTIET
jgi:hypothetical protein